MGLLDRVMRPRGNPAPPGTYVAELGTLYSPEGPSGPLFFKSVIRDADAEDIGVFVYAPTPTTLYAVNDLKVTQEEWLDALERVPDGWFTVVLERPGELTRLEVSLDG